MRSGYIAVLGANASARHCGGGPAPYAGGLGGSIAPADERTQQEILLAREVALRSVVREQQRLRGEAASPPEAVAPQVSSSPDRNLPLAEKLPAIEQLQHENADLRQQLEQLRREVETLKNPAKLTSKPGR